MKTIRSRIIQGRVMPDGWHYPQPNKQGTTTRITADTLPDLLEAVINYRLVQVMPLGDPLGDIEQYVCSTYPDFCHSVYGAVVQVEVNIEQQSGDSRALLDRMIMWIEAQTKGIDATALVTRDEAERRAAICEQCPMNVRWKDSCSTCNENVDRLTTIIRMGQALPRDRKLHACRVFGHDNRAAVWLKKDRVGTSPEAPGHCWVLQP